MESLSEHPVADAIVRAAAEGAPLVAAEGFQSGYGVRAVVEDVECWLGPTATWRAKALTSRHWPRGNEDRKPSHGALRCHRWACRRRDRRSGQTGKPRSHRTHEKGLAVAMIAATNAKPPKLARETGIDHVIAGVLPDGKGARQFAPREQAHRLCRRRDQRRPGV